MIEEEAAVELLRFVAFDPRYVAATNSTSEDELPLPPLKGAGGIGVVQDEDVSKPLLLMFRGSLSFSILRLDARSSRLGYHFFFSRIPPTRQRRMLLKRHMMTLQNQKAKMTKTTS